MELFQIFDVLHCPKNIILVKGFTSLLALLEYLTSTNQIISTSSNFQLHPVPQSPALQSFYSHGPPKWNFHTPQLSQVCTPLFLPKFPIFMNFKLHCSIVSFQQVRMFLSRREITKLISPYFSENSHLKWTTVCFILFFLLLNEVSEYTV